MAASEVIGESWTKISVFWNVAVASVSGVTCFVHSFLFLATD